MRLCVLWPFDLHHNIFALKFTLIRSGCGIHGYEPLFGCHITTPFYGLIFRFLFRSLFPMEELETEIEKNTKFKRKFVQKVNKGTMDTLDLFFSKRKILLILHELL